MVVSPSLDTTGANGEAGDFHANPASHSKAHPPQPAKEAGTRPRDGGDQRPGNLLQGRVQGREGGSPSFLWAPHEGRGGLGWIPPSLSPSHRSPLALGGEWGALSRKQASAGPEGSGDFNFRYHRS